LFEKEFGKLEEGMEIPHESSFFHCVFPRDDPQATSAFFIHAGDNQDLTSKNPIIEKMRTTFEKEHTMPGGGLFVKTVTKQDGYTHKHIEVCIVS
jgi:hypothetical protein